MAHLLYRTCAIPFYTAYWTQLEPNHTSTGLFQALLSGLSHFPNSDFEICTFTSFTFLTMFPSNKPLTFPRVYPAFHRLQL